MDRRQFFKDKYVELKSLNGGVKPLKKEFLKFCKLQEDQLMRAFGKDAYSTLQGECGDAPNKLKMERASLPVILEQYGSLARKYQRVPVHADWLMEDFYPRPGGLSRIHKITFANFPTIFIKENGDRPEWKDVVKILETKAKSNGEKIDKAFQDVVNKIIDWTPDRKRVIEEGYKIELRKYLEQFYDLEEEVGESNVDILVSGRYPVEIKKDPTLSEYDRLLGQMIRHSKIYGSAIAVVTGLSSADRFKKFRQLFDEVCAKMSMYATLINK